ncbi:MAG: TonB-dependent receptor, partial [Acidobacteriaceae bacterium]|nr:TonB-dependent receptor [Acidobacteriaceae bacterium]
GDNGLGVGSGRGGIGAGDVYSATISGTYLAQPNIVIDSHYAVTIIGTNSLVPRANENLGRDFLGIPGTNGPTPEYGGWPQFSISSYNDIGNAGNGPIFYDDRQYQYAANASWVHGRHNVRFGYEWDHQDLNHFDPTSAPGHLTFTGGATAVRMSNNNSSMTSQFNSYATFLLGLVSSANSDQYPFNGNRAVVIMPTYRLYVQDQWQALSNLTVNLGLGWNYFPMGTRSDRGLERYNYQTNQVTICGFALTPRDCGYDVSKKLFSPSIGLAFRPASTWVIRTGFALNYDPETYAYNRDLLTNYPEALSFSLSAPDTYHAATTLAQGLPGITVPDISSGVVRLPSGYSVSSLPQHPVRDYILSWNFTLQKQLPFGFIGQAGYVATRGVKIPQQLNLNVGQVNGGTGSEPFNKLFGTTATIRLLTPVNHTHYDALQSTLSRRFANGVQLNFGYTFSKNTGICCDDLSDGAPAIQLPQYINLNRSLEPTDRPHNFNASTVWELPFGKGKPWINRGRILPAIAGGWQLSGLFVRYSGLPFSVTSSSTSLNAPGNTQRADQVKPKVAILGGTGPGQPWFDPLAFAAVNEPRFGTAGFYTLRGPRDSNLDLGLYRAFKVTERIGLQVRADAFNISNTPHFDNPSGLNVSSLQLNPDGTIKNLAGFSTITAVKDVGREGVDQRELRLGVRISF